MKQASLFSERRRSAIISKCGHYRYELVRGLSSDLPRLAKVIVFVMLNPSKADWKDDDPTVRRCIRFAERLGGSELRIYNAFALRATDPYELRKAVDPVGPENDGYLSSIPLDWMTIVGWGVQKVMRERQHRVAELLQTAKRNVWCLGTTKDGFPRHPLYVRADEPLVRWVLKENSC